MRFDTSQFMKMGQHMKLAPHMIQSMEILQMNLAELQERIDQELESNATLEVVENQSDADAQSTQAGSDEGQTRIEGGGESGGDAGGDGNEDTIADNDDSFTPTLDDGEMTSEEVPIQMGDRSGEDDFERLESFEHDHPDAAENDNQSESFTRDAEGEGQGDSQREYEPSTNPNADPDGKSGALANHAAHAEHFTDQLFEQWRYADVKPDVRALGEVLIPYIEEDGYLRTPLETIADVQGRGATPAELARGLQAIQLLLEPPGLGARDMRECLLLQIDARQADAQADEMPQWELARAIVDAHLDDLMANRLPKIAGKLGIRIDDLKGGITMLRRLKLAPGRELSTRPVAGIIPDGIVEYDAGQDRYVAYLNDRRLPNLRINQEYALLARDKSAPKVTREFLKTNLGNAAFLIDAIAQRKRTLLRVLEAVVAAQREFFDYGPQSIKPLPMTKVAEQLGIHVATVSRAVAEKWIQTPRGVVPLRKFFTGGTTTDTGEEVSWEAIKAALTEIVENENKADPLSDDALAEALKAKGFDIARRTVAKYRGQLNIPTGRLRKTH